MYATLSIALEVGCVLTLQVTQCMTIVAVHLGVKMADTLSFTAKVDMVDFWV